MKLCALVFSVLGLSGCGARSVAALIPKLDLELGLRRREAALGGVSGSGQTSVVLGAQLRWSPSWRATDPGLTLTDEDSVSCDVGEASCLSALYDADPELVGVLEVP